MLKKRIVLIPSAYKYNAISDIINFANLLKDKLEVIIVSDYPNNEIIDGIKYVNHETSNAKYYIYVSEYLIDAGTTTRKDRVYKNQKTISVWHGTPYKKMFIDLDSKHYIDAYNYSLGYKTMISPSRLYTEKFLRNSMQYKGNVLELGSSRTDSLFISEEIKIEIKNKLGIKNKKIILYAPTYRQKGQIKLPFEAHKIVDENTILLVKPHYLNQIKINKKNVLDLTTYPNINELLAITDILITDYSSLMFDYACLEKPIILYQYDFQKYEQDRGFMYDIKQFISSQNICYTEEKLYELLENTNSLEIANLKQNFYPHDFGNSTPRIIENLEFNYDTRKIPEIIFLVNEVNQIGGIHSFITTLAKQFKKHYNCKLIIIGINEFNTTNEEIHIFGTEELFDLKLSKTFNPGAVEAILKNTNGIIISTQMGSHNYFQEHLANKNVIAMFHGDTKDIINKTHYKWHMDALKNNTFYNYKKFLFLTQSNMEILKPHIDKKTYQYFSYIPNMIELEYTNIYNPNSNIFVAVSRFDTDKNIFALIDIFKHPDLNPKYKLHIYGDGPLKEELQTQIIANNLEHKVIIKGFETNKDKIYTQKQGLIFTSLSEGMGLVILEAYANNIPVYTFDEFTAAKDIVNEKVGHLTSNQDITQYVKKLNENKQLNPQDFQNEIKKYNSEVIFKQWETLFSEIDNIPIFSKTRSKKQMWDIQGYIRSRYQKLDMKKKVRLRKIHDYILETILLLKINKKSKISVIIPYYNNETTLANAIRSVKKQKYKNIEIIVVNDGSKLNNLEIVKNVKYYEKENEGPGITRNFGMDKATGEYCFFLDADDTLNQGALIFLLYYALKNDLAVVSGKTTRIDNNDKLKRSIWFYSIYNVTYVNKKENRSFIQKDTLCTNKLYHLSSLRASGIRFKKGLYEDKLFVHQIYNHFPEIGITSQHIYNWMVYGENTTITTTLSLSNFKQRLEKIYSIWEQSTEMDKMQQYHFAINHDFRIYVNKFLTFSKSDQEIIYKEISMFLNSNKSYYYHKYVTIVTNIAYLQAIFDDDFEEFKKICEFIKENNE